MLWIKQSYINPCAVRSDASSPFLCIPSPWVESRQNATCAGWQAFPRPRRLQPSSSSSSSFSCSSYWQRQSCLCSEKLICSTDELHRSTRLGANMDVIVNEGINLQRNEKKRECGKLPRDAAQVFAHVCICKCTFISTRCWQTAGFNQFLALEADVSQASCTLQTMTEQVHFPLHS